MKGIISVKIDDQGLNKVMEELKESSRFNLEPIHINAGLNTIYAGILINTITHEFWLTDPQIVVNRLPIDDLGEFDYLPEIMEIRLTNTTRRSLIRNLVQRGKWSF